jgi:hypothetical protein
MAENNSIKEKLANLRKQRLRSFIKNLIFIALFATVMAVGSIWLDMKNVFFFVFIALLPTLTSILWDKKPGRFASKTVAAFNITGLFPFLMAIGSSGSPDGTAITILSNTKAWVLIYGFSIFGWAVILLVPKITMIYLEIEAKYRIKKMEKFQQDLLEEWGEDIKK